MSETDLMRQLQRRASEAGARLFRQNTGMAWVGKAERGYAGRVVRLDAGDVVIRKARPFHAGVTGMSDLGGWRPRIIEPHMVGSTVAVVAQVEVKAGAPVTAEQNAWIEAVRQAGGLAGVARSESDLLNILGFE